MKYAMPLLVKFLVILFVFGVIFWMAGMSLVNILWISLVATGVSFIGDLIFLPRYGNLITTGVDFGIMLFVGLAGSAFFFGGIGQMGLAVVTPAILIALWEAFFHKFLRKRFFEDAFPSIDATYEKFDGKAQFGSDELAHLQTEFSNEFDIGSPSGERPKKTKKYVPHRRKTSYRKKRY